MTGLPDALPDALHDEEPVGWRPGAVLAVLLALGLAMRTLGAWVYEFAHTSDHGIICLMVKHMLEGKGFPVFFYGHSYMGSIEPAVSAALSALLGLTGFWINMGTALTGFAFLPLVYRWGRGAAGRTGGLAALAFCVIGPPQYFQFVSWADGGYAAIPFFICLVMVLALRLLAREMAGARAGHGAYLVLGVAAGLGWWQSPLLIPAFLACTVLFLAVLGRAVFSARLWSGAAGFLLGSAPLWIWNLLNRWQTFDMLKTHERPDFLEGMRLFYGKRLPDLLELHRQGSVARVALGLLLILLTAAAVRLWIAQWRARARERALYLGGVFLFLVIFSVLFGRSRFARVNALRYVVVLIPALGVLFGAGTAWLVRTLRAGRPRLAALGWLPMAALIAVQAVELPKRFRERRETAAFMPVAAAFGDFLRAQGVRHLYADYQVRRANHGLNFVLNEEFVFSPQLRERYRPYAEALERAESPAVLNDSLGFRAFLDATGGAAATGGVEGLAVHYAVRPPPDNWQPVPPAAWRAAHAPGGADVLDLLTDGHAASAWTDAGQAGTRSTLEIRFDGPQRVTGVRLLSDGPGYPGVCGVEGWREDEGDWATLATDLPVTRYFWDGPRFYWGGEMYRLERRFAPFETDRLRVRLARAARGNAVVIQELQVLAETADAPEPPSPAELDEVEAMLRARGVTRLYADRWAANVLHERFDGRLMTPPLRHLLEREALPVAMTLDEHTAILVREREADGSRRALVARFVGARETELGRWRLFDFPGDQAAAVHVRTPGLLWTGYGCVRDGDRAWAVAASRTAREWGARGEPERALELARAAVAACPRYAPLYETLAGLHDAAGEPGQAGVCRMLAEQVEKPDVPVVARFKGGPELAGVSFDPAAPAGGTLAIRYFWRGLERVNPDDLIVTVHFKAGENTVFRADYPFPPGAGRAEERGESEVWVEERLVTVPADVKPGELRIMMEVIREDGRSRRLTVESEHRMGKRAVLIPVPFRVLPSVKAEKDKL